MQVQFFLLSLSSSCAVVMQSRTVTMSGIMMKIAVIEWASLQEREYKEYEENEERHGDTSFLGEK
jgi:hypothetical protein